MPSLLPPEEGNKNADLLYEYTKYCIDDVKSHINTLGTKLAVVMEVSALLLIGLRITSSYQNFVPPHPASLYYSYLVLKYCACIALAIAIIVSIVGLYPQEIKNDFTPELLLLSNKSASTENSRLAIAKAWMDNLKNLQLYKEKRDRLFHWALVALAIGVLLAGAVNTDSLFLAIAGRLVGKS